MSFQNLRKETFDELNNRIIPFWANLRDNVNGGFYGEVSFDLKILKNAPKGSVYISRILWFFSECYSVRKNKKDLDNARHAYEFLRDYLIDREHEKGGVFWTVSADGKPLDTTKHVYAAAFAVYALSSYYKCAKDENALALAFGLYDTVERNCRDGYGYGEAYDRDFNAAENDKLSENNIIADKTMNTLLHIFEGYSNLYGVSKSPAVEKSMRLILADFKNKIFNKKLKRLDVFFDKKMNSLIDLQSYGHDIEASWLIDWGTRLLRCSALTKEIGKMTSTLAESVMERAYKNNMVLNECENSVQDKKGVWWVQAEAILGFLNYYTKHPDREEYKTAAENIWNNFIKPRIIDRREGGEWFEQVDENGVPDSEKPSAGLWKCPYHNGRMCLMLIEYFNIKEFAL